MKKTIISAASLTALSAVAAANISASEVTVDSGDTLWSLSSEAGKSVEEVKSLNNLTSDIIFPGDVLKIDGETQAAAPAEETTEEVSSDATTYTIEAGDTLFSIANQFDVSVSELQEWNNLTSDLIFVGKTINVAGGSEAAEEAPAVEETSAPAVEEVEETEEVSEPAPAPAEEPQVSGGNAASVAHSVAAGKSYVYGGNSATAVDCSAFTQQFMKAFNGKDIPRTTYGQQAAGTQVSSPQPGDLVFFNNYSHVGVYIGNGQMVDALNPSEGVGERAVSYVHGHVDGYYRF